MNKEEIKAKLDQAKTDKFEINKQVQQLEKQLRDIAEKSKLRHGDFGVFVDGKARVDIDDTMYDKDGRCGNPKDSEFYTIFGNIFDLLEGWSEDLTYFEFDVHRCRIDTVNFPHAPIHIAGNWHTLAEAEEIWHKLGRLIMTLKKKQGGE